MNTTNNSPAIEQTNTIVINPFETYEVEELTFQQLNSLTDRELCEYRERLETARTHAHNEADYRAVDAINAKMADVHHIMAARFHFRTMIG